MIILSVLICTALGLQASHIGAGIVASSTLVTGIFLVWVNTWKLNVDRVHFYHAQPSAYTRYDEDGQSRSWTRHVNEARDKKSHVDSFKYLFTNAREKFLNGLIAAEVFIASLGTFIWGFGDLVYPDPLSWPV